MANENRPADEPVLAEQPIAPASPGIRQIIAAAVRALGAVWLAPVLLFLILGPNQTAGVLSLVLMNRADFQPAPGRPVPTEIFVMAIIGAGSCFWFFVILFGVPWVTGGAAAQFKDQLVSIERHRGFVECANRYFGRMLVLLVLYGLLLTALYMPHYALTLWMMFRGGYVAGQPDMSELMQSVTHPAIMASMALYSLVAMSVTLLAALCIAATVVEDLDPIQAIRRGLTFVRQHLGDVGRLYLIMFALSIPNILFQQGFMLLQWPDVALLGLSLLTAVYSVCLLSLMLATAVSLYVARRPAEFVT